MAMLTMNNLTLEERFAALDDDKARFVTKVYGGLTISLIVATIACVFGLQWFGAMSAEQAYSSWRMLWWVELGLIVLSMFLRLSGPFGWLFLMAFVSITGLTLAPVLIIYQQISGNGTIAMALGLTATTFLSLSAYVRYSGKDFSYLGGFLWMATIGLIITGLLLWIWPSQNVSYWQACIGALIFCGWILFDTSAVTRQYYQENNVVGAVLKLYLDILLLFMYLLQILSGRRE
ncbi:MAG: Bax inhibitor-1 family protein [Planctomycetota bacterium]